MNGIQIAAVMVFDQLYWYCTYNQSSDLPELGRRWLLGERPHTVPLARLSLNTDEHDCGRGRSGGVKILDSVA